METQKRKTKMDGAIMRMNVNDALAELMYRKGLGISDLARRLGCTRQNVHYRLNTKIADGMTTKHLVEYLDVMGYELAIVPVNSNLPDRTIIIGVDEE